VGRAGGRVCGKGWRPRLWEGLAAASVGRAGGRQAHPKSGYWQLGWPPPWRVAPQMHRMARPADLIQHIWGASQPQPVPATGQCMDLGCATGTQRSRVHPRIHVTHPLAPPGRPRCGRSRTGGRGDGTGGGPGRGTRGRGTRGQRHITARSPGRRSRSRHQRSRHQRSRHQSRSGGSRRGRRGGGRSGTSRQRLSTGAAAEDSTDASRLPHGAGLS
jgi:hypothetical protein